MPAKTIETFGDKGKVFGLVKQTAGLKPKNKIWSFDECASEAIKYSSRKEFALNARKQYSAAVRKGWINLVCGHMEGKRKPRNYWTYERCEEVARTYTTINDFRKKSNVAYGCAQRNGWIHTICMHMHRLHKPSKYWNFERCRDEALKYNSRSAFADGSRSAYTVSRKNKWLDRFCAHMISCKELKTHWTFERCKKEAAKYVTRSDFSKNAVGAYSSALKNGWLEDICVHMGQPQRRRNYWTRDRCRLEAAKYNTRADFSKNSNGAYFVCRANKWLDELCAHMVEFKKQKRLERVKEKATAPLRKNKSVEDNGRVKRGSRKGNWMDDLFTIK